MISPYLAATSAIILLLHTILLSKPARTLYTHFFHSKLPPTEDIPQESHVSLHAGFFGEARDHIAHQGGVIIFAYKIARLIGCLAFFGLCLTTSILEDHKESHSNGLGKWGKRRKHERSQPQSPTFSEAEWLQIAMSISAVSAPLAKHFR
jgi:hypothetical protein